MFTLLTLGQNTFIAQLIAPEIIALFVTGASLQTVGSTLAFFWQRLNNQNDQEVAISDFFTEIFPRNPLFVNFSLQRSKNKTILCGFHGPLTTFFNKRIESMRKGTSKAGGNKSQLIRDFAAANPTMKVSDIVKTLTEQGHKVYPAIVSQALRGSAGAKKPKAKRGRKPGTKNAVKTTSTELNLTNIKAAAAFVKATGGVDAAITSIKSFEKIAELLK